MKKGLKILIKNALLIKTIIFSLLLTSCDKNNVGELEDLNPKEQYVALTGATNQTNLATLNVVTAPDIVLQDTFKILHLKSTLAAEEDIIANITLDQSLVEKYNSTYKTNFKAMPIDAINIPDLTLQIDKGNTVSSAVNIILKDLDVFNKQNTNELLAVYKIKDIKSPNNSKTTLSNEVYVLFKAVGRLEARLSSGLSNTKQGTLRFQRAPDQTKYLGLPTSLIASLNYVVGVDRKISLQQDNSLVAAYNSSNNSSHTEFPLNKIKINNGEPIIIKAGQNNLPVSLQIDESVLSSLTANSYILPLKLSGQENTYANTSNDIVYFIITSDQQNIDARNTGLTGTEIDRSPWSIAVSSFYTTEFAVFVGNSAIGKGSPSEVHGWLSNRIGSTHTVTLNMGSVKNVKGFKLFPQNFFGSQYNVAEMTVESSTNGTTWTSQGTFKGTATQVSLEKNEPQEVKFFVPVSGSHFKFTITKNYSTYPGADADYLGDAAGIKSIVALQ